MAGINRKITLRLNAEDDAALLAALDMLPPRHRNALIRQALTWYFVPGGFAELVRAVQSQPVGTPEVPPAPAPDFTANLDQALAQFGWDGDEDAP